MIHLEGFGFFKKKKNKDFGNLVYRYEDESFYILCGNANIKVSFWKEKQISFIPSEVPLRYSDTDIFNVEDIYRTDHWSFMEILRVLYNQEKYLKINALPNLNIKNKEDLTDEVIKTWKEKIPTLDKDIQQVEFEKETNKYNL